MHNTEFGAIFGVLDPSKDIESITTLKRETAELIARAKKRQSPIVITQNGRASAVLQDVESYERQKKALLLLKLIAQGESDERAGRTMSGKAAQARFRKRIEDAKKLK